MRELLPWKMPDDYWRDVTVVPLRDSIVGDVRPMLLILLGAVALLLLVACANVANLMLARVTARRKEMAIRGALGARHTRIVRQLLTESLVLGLTGGGVGLAVAVGAVAVLRRAFPPDLPRLGDVAIDARVLLFALGASLATGLLFGIVPALRASRTGVGETIAEGARAGTEPRAPTSVRRSRCRTDRRLCHPPDRCGSPGAQLLAVARGGSGISGQNVVVAKVAPPSFRYPGAGDRARFYRDLLERLAALSRNGAVAVGSGSPSAATPTAAYS